MPENTRRNNRETPSRVGIWIAIISGFVGLEGTVITVATRLEHRMTVIESHVANAEIHTPKADIKDMVAEGPKGWKDSRAKLETLVIELTRKLDELDREKRDQATSNHGG